MPGVSPSSLRPLQLQALIDMIVQSMTFQLWVASHDEEDAKRNIYVDAFIPEDQSDLSQRRPFVIIQLGSNNRERSSVDAYTKENTYNIVFEANVSEEYSNDHINAGYEFLNAVDAIIDEVCAISGNPGTLNIRSIKDYCDLTRSNPREGEEGDYFYYGITVEVGI
jgi:hypothetical protein